MAAPGIDHVRKLMVRPSSYRAVHERNVAGSRAASQPRDLRTSHILNREAALPVLTAECYGDFAAVQPIWKEFEARAISTLYQSTVWCQAWLETAGQAFGAKPRCLIARDANGQLRFILPLQVRRRQGIRVLEWLGSPHHNYGFGLFDPAFIPHAEAWFAANWSSLLETAGEWDAVSLTEMPDHILGRRNPMRPMFNMRGANLSFVLDIDRDFDALDKRKRGSDRRRTARKSEASLKKMGEIGFGLPEGLTAIHAMIDAMFEQQEQRLAELGIRGGFGPAERQFIHRIADLQDPANPMLAPYHLTCGGETLSVMLGGIHANGYWALISSLASGPHRRHSPGDLALRRTIAACCSRGLGFFDFSAGDTPYKRQWSDQTVELFHALRARNIRGLAWCCAVALRLVAKRAIKRTPVLRTAAKAVRTLVLGKRGL